MEPTADDLADPLNTLLQQGIAAHEQFARDNDELDAARRVGRVAEWVAAQNDDSTGDAPGEPAQEVGGD